MSINEIEVLGHTVIYQNPLPTRRSLHGFFPGIVRMGNGDLVCLFTLGEAFESNDQQTYVSRSRDGGRTWSLQGPLHERMKRGLVSLKPTVLRDGRLIAVGYGFYRDNPEILTNPETGGLPAGENLVSFSSDDGTTWAIPEKMRLSRPEVLEISGPSIQLRGSGELLAVGTPLVMWDGARPSGAVGVVVRSTDGGATWSDADRYFVHPTITPLEARVCQLADGRVVCIVWALDEANGKGMNNHIVVSRDDGRTWSQPIDIGVRAQASNLLPLGGNRLLAVHAHREDPPVGVFVRLVELADHRWQSLSEANVYRGPEARRVTGFGDMGVNLKFGQPAALALGGGEFLIYHWTIEDGQGKILGHHVRVRT